MTHRSKTSKRVGKPKGSPRAKTTARKRAGAKKKATKKKAAKKKATKKKVTKKKATKKTVGKKKAAKKKTAKKKATKKKTGKKKTAKKSRTKSKRTSAESAVAPPTTPYPPSLVGTSDLPVETTDEWDLFTEDLSQAYLPSDGVATPNLPAEMTDPWDLLTEDAATGVEEIDAPQPPTPDAVGQEHAEGRPGESVGAEPPDLVVLESTEATATQPTLAGTSGVTDWSKSALLSAAERGDAESVHSLLAHGIEPGVLDLREATRDWTPLMHGARAGHVDVVRALLEAGADPDATDDPANEHRATVRFMSQHEDIEHIATVGLWLGRSACHFAAARGHAEVVRLLIGRGAAANATDHAGKTPLMLACEAGSVAVAKVLIESGGDVGATDLRHTDALARAARSGQAELVQLLLDAGAEVDTRDGEQRTSLMSAVAGAHIEATRALLAAGADIWAVDWGGFGILCLAIHAVQQLVGDDPSIHNAPEDKILPIVYQLLEAGIDDRPDGTGIRPSRRAEEQGHEEIAGLMKSVGGSASDPYRQTG